MFLGIISIFFPSFISLKIEMDLLKNKKNKLLVIDYCIFCLINNLIAVILMYYLFGVKSDILNCINLYPGVFTKYCIISIILAFILALIAVVISRNVEVKVEIQKNN